MSICFKTRSVRFLLIAALAFCFGHIETAHAYRSDTHLAKWLPDGPTFCVRAVRFRAERSKGVASQITADELDDLVRSIRQGLRAQCRRLPNRLFIVHKDKSGKEVSTILYERDGFRIPDRSIFVATPPQSELQSANPDIFVRLKSPAERSVAYDKFVAMARTLTDGTPTEPLTEIRWDPAFIQKEQSRYQRALTSGTIYKSKQFWRPYGDSFVQKTFEGSEVGLMSIVDINSVIMRAAVLSYIRSKDNYCASSFGPNDAIFKTTEKITTFNGYGRIIDETVRDAGTTQVNRRFAPLYGYYTDAKNSPAAGRSVLPDIAAVAGNGTPPILDYALRLSEMYLKANQDHARLFQTQGCDHPIIQQYEENLYRYALGKPNVQKARFAIDNARSVSDTPPTGREPPRSVNDVCLSYGMQEPDDIAYCSCVHNSMTSNFGNRALEVYLDARRIRDVAKKLGDNSPIRPLLVSLNIATSACSRY